MSTRQHLPRISLWQPGLQQVKHNGRHRLACMGRANAVIRNYTKSLAFLLFQALEWTVVSGRGCPSLVHPCFSKAKDGRGGKKVSACAL